jgi:hypothetical protein
MLLQKMRYRKSYSIDKLAKQRRKSLVVVVVVVLKTETKLKIFDEDAFPERDALFPNWLLCTCTSIQTPQSLDSFSKLQRLNGRSIIRFSS